LLLLRLREGVLGRSDEALGLLLLKGWLPKLLLLVELLLLLLLLLLLRLEGGGSRLSIELLLGSRRLGLKLLLRPGLELVLGSTRRGGPSTVAPTTTK